MLHLYARYLFVFPISSILSVDPQTADASEYDYVDDNPSFSTELPRKQTPLDHSDIAYSFSLLLALELRYCYCFIGRSYAAA